MSHVLGIDIGTSGIKVAAMNNEGNISYLSKQSYSLLYPKQDWIEIDVNDIWHKTKELINKTIKKVSGNGGSVDAISLSTFCNSSVFMSEDGDALGNGIMYLDQRSQEQAKSIRESVGDTKLYEITRNRLEPGMYSATTLLWVKENLPDIYDQAYKWGNLSTFLLNKLTGQFVMDWTQASFTGLFDIVNYQWSDQICNQLGIDHSILPKTIEPSKCIGEFLEIPVVVGAADTACSSLALGLETNEMFESVGTSNVLTVCTDNPDHLDTRFLNRCHVMKNQWLSHGAMSTPGATIQWFDKNFLDGEGESTSILEQLPKESSIGANGVFFLPYMQGERSPIWDPQARGVFVGLHLNSTKADMFRSILEGTAFGLRQIHEIIQENYRLEHKSFKSIGGGSKNQSWAQIKANVLKKEINIQEISETAAYGCCLLAAKYVGYYNDLAKASDFLTNETTKRIEPQSNTFVMYDKLYRKFNKLYPSLKDFFEEKV